MKYYGFPYVTLVFYFWWCVKKQSHGPSKVVGVEQGLQGQRALTLGR